MDRFSRNYGIFLGLLALVGVAWWLSTIDLRARALNGMLRDDPVVSSYGYPFRVQSVANRVARMGTPRTAQVPAVRFLTVLRPELARLGADDPELLAAQQELARVQGRARELVIADEAVDEVRWVLDREWFARQGVML